MKGRKMNGFGVRCLWRRESRKRSGSKTSAVCVQRLNFEGEWEDWLVDESDSQERVLVDHEEKTNRLEALRGALSVLNERERRIFEARRLEDDPLTLEQLSEEFGVSRERVRQIEVRAFEKVQSAVKEGIARREALPPPPARISPAPALLR